MEIRFDAADTIIFMDFSRIVCLYRVVKRRIQNVGKVRQDMGKGCPEKIDWNFIKWIWTYPKLIRPIILNKINKYAEIKRVILLHNSKEVKQFIENLRKCKNDIKDS